jgi:aminocarboxymuconate-semialdehyde decarboxylase
MRIDVYPHILPPAYYKRMLEVAPSGTLLAKRMGNVKPLHDLGERLRVMDEYEDYHQVLTLGGTPIEAIGEPNVTAELARLANDGMAEIVAAHPHHFYGFVASPPMDDVDAAMREIDRAVNDLGATGIQIHTNIKGKPLDLPQFEPVFARMAELRLPIWLHPTRTPAKPDYIDEPRSYYDMWWAFGWPYETTVAMGRMVFSGFFDRWPSLIVLTHHLGGMIPYFEQRAGAGLDALGERSDDPTDLAALGNIEKRPFDYFHMFYGDTALFGSVAGMQCGLSFFGADHVLFGTDMPFVGQIRDTLDGIEQLIATPEDKTKILEGNARRLLRLRIPGEAA